MTDYVPDNAPNVSAPKPESVHRTLQGVVVSLALFDKEYREAFGVAYSRVVRDDGLGGARLAASKPTEGAAMANRQRRLRRDLAKAAESLEAMGKDLKEGRYLIRRGMEADGIDPLLDNVRVLREEREGKIGPPLHRSEMRPLEGYQRQREERGEA